MNKSPLLFTLVHRYKELPMCDIAPPQNNTCKTLEMTTCLCSAPLIRFLKVHTYLILSQIILYIPSNLVTNSKYPEQFIN